MTFDQKLPPSRYSTLALRPSRHSALPIRPVKSAFLKNVALCFQSLAHCPLSLTSLFALCFDSLTNSSSCNSPVLILMQHALCFFSRDYVAFAGSGLHAQARGEQSPRLARWTQPFRHSPVLASPLPRKTGPGFMHTPTQQKRPSPAQLWRSLSPIPSIGGGGSPTESLTDERKGDNRKALSHRDTGRPDRE
jgi:hypothetical protein